MMEKVSDWITNTITGNEAFTQVILIAFVVICFGVSGWIIYKTGDPAASGIYIGTPEEQLKVEEI